MSKMEKLQEELNAIKARNKKVEIDKAWETSLIRRSIVFLFTYAVMVLVMYSIGVAKPLFSAIIPSIGYFLSTLSIGFIKSWWIKKH